MRAAFFAVVLASPFAFGTTPLAPADAPESGGRYLALLQADWPSGDGVVRSGWEFRVGSGVGAENVSGLVALSLLETGLAEHDDFLLAGARERAKADRAALARRERLSAPDLELVARVAALDDDAPALSLAWSGLDARVAAAGGASGLVASVVERRRGAPDLVGYDVALYVEAALACGERHLARSLVDEALAHRDEWLADPDSTFGLVSEGALVVAEVRTGDVARAGEEAALLMLRQDRDGAFHGRETEPTAWAARALSLYATATGSRSAERSASRARRWLERTQLASGAFADYHDGLPEPFVGEVHASTSAEVLRALVAAPPAASR